MSLNDDRQGELTFFFFSDAETDVKKEDVEVKMDEDNDEEEDEVAPGTEDLGAPGDEGIVLSEVDLMLAKYSFECKALAILYNVQFVWNFERFHCRIYMKLKFVFWKISSVRFTLTQ